jgi:hypothetical protein
MQAFGPRDGQGGGRGMRGIKSRIGSSCATQGQIAEPWGQLLETRRET